MRRPELDCNGALRELAESGAIFLIESRYCSEPGSGQWITASRKTCGGKIVMYTNIVEDQRGRYVEHRLVGHQNVG